MEESWRQIRDPREYGSTRQVLQGKTYAITNNADHIGKEMCLIMKNFIMEL
jgi:hypothetical protein